ncbi:F-box/WD repeat-containing protein 10 [Nematolebias whitei]|uniref:F-box/WD repeat-containing protein 10 n=1 Tax=Nematolebias whitei TaxID=451745 RepID=UPI00189ADD44|nr:F-box/WD repeat-containing protein 10 [Nematolebias whitei]
MDSAKVRGQDASCVHVCGMCPRCVFAPKPPGSAARRLWTVSDEFERRFVVALLSRCRNVKQLENIQKSLSGTSWPWCTYARSGRSPRDSGSRCQKDRKPLCVDTDAILRWFNSSPDWMKTNYLCCLLSMCDFELLRMLTNLTSVLLVRLKRGYLQFNVSNQNFNGQQDPEDPALMVVPGASKSMSGVSQHRDFVSCLPVNLAKRILGLLGEHTLKRCKKVCWYWQHLTEETMEEIRFRRSFKDQDDVILKVFHSVNVLSPTYANMVEVSVPINGDEKDEVHPAVQKMKSFKAAHAKIQTKPVQMEERNVYCGAYFTKVLLKEEYQHRVLDYRGGFLMATTSKDRLLRLLCVAPETKPVAVVRGHGVIRAVQFCEDRGLLITAGYDACIRCWNLQTDRCEKVLYGHTGTINCLDVHADKLVSGAKDHTVKVWSIQTWSLFKDFNFKHRGSVLCVKIHKSFLCSSCIQGQVKLWNMETASLLRVINAHKSAVKCLFLNDWHLLSGDSAGKVMAWSVSCEDKQCLKMFNHPKEVKSLTLLYLRVVTGCLDGKIRVFNFLTGDCLRDIRTESESGRILSLHFQDHSILVNSTVNVQLFQFSKVFWDYTDPLQEGAGDGVAQEANGENVKQSVIESEKAASGQMKRRGPHHPPTRDAILLRVGASQRALRLDEVSINMEGNARLRDSWGPQTTRDRLGLSADKQNLQLQPRPNTCLPILQRAASRHLISCPQSREVSTAPASAKRQSARNSTASA